jgi:hypothetical protein
LFSVGERKSTRTLAALLALALLAGCGGGGGTTAGAPPSANEATSRTDAAPRGDDEPGSPQTVERARCPEGVPECRSATGRILYVERVDPDGDGDAHFVILDSQGITLPGLTAIDVRRGLRPHPLPGPGDLVSAAGPVQTGSYGQSQIHALVLHVSDD